MPSQFHEPNTCPICDDNRRQNESNLPTFLRDDDAINRIYGVEERGGPTFCTRCNSYHPTSGPTVCIHCNDCGRYHQEYHDFGYCEGCDRCHLRPLCVDCEECGSYHHPPACTPYEEPLIHSYSYRPDPRFLGDGPLYLGMELELEIGTGSWDSVSSVDGAAEAVQEVVGDYAYLKEDGSIDYGFELVTHPMSYAFLQDRFPMTNMMATLRDNGARSTRETGIHVHVSRAGFTGQSHVYRWLKLLYRNEVQVSRIARRTSHWGAFRPEDRMLGKYFAKGWPSTGRLNPREERELVNRCRTMFGTSYYDVRRYSAVNVNTGHGTFEVRVFRSTTNPRKAMAALGLTHASVEYTRELTASDVCRNGGWEWSNFYSWVADHDQYVDLRKEMEDRGCVS